MSAQYDGSIKFDTKIDESKFEKGVSKLKGMAIAGAAGIGLALAGAAVKGGKYALSLASDLQEVQNVVDVTFGDNAKEIEKWAKNAGKSFGMAELAAKQYTGTMGAMLKSMGLSDKEVLKMSTDLTGLAGDFASFYNLDHSAAFDKIRAGISGETEPLKQLGINMSVANLEAYALSQGMKTAYKDMTQAEQATLRYNYILKAGADAQGDFARTSDSLANQLRIAQLSVTEIASSIGEKLLPAATGGMQIINSGLTWLSETIAGNKSEIDLLIESIDAQSAAYEEQKIIQGEKAAADLAELDYTKQLGEELFRLVDANGRVADSDKSRVGFILNELNSALGTEYSLTGNIIKNYDEMKDSVLELVEAKHLEILMQQAETNYTNAIKSKAEAEAKYAEAHKAHLLSNTEETRIALEKARADFEKITQDQIAYAEASKLALEGETAAAIAYLEKHNAAYNETETAAAQFADGTKSKLDALKNSFDNNLSILHGYIELYNETGSETALSYINSFVNKVITSRDEYIAAGGTVANEFISALNSSEVDLSDLQRSIRLQLKSISMEQFKMLTAGANDINSSGFDFSAGYAVGIESGVDVSEAATRTLVNSSIETIKKTQDSNSPAKETISLGVDFAQGYSIGIENGKSAAIKSAINMARASIDAAKGELDINSPSKVSKDEIGKYIPLGMAKGIEENSDAVIESFDSMLEILEYRRRFDIINEDEYYTDLEKLRDKYFKAGTKEWLDYTEKIYSYEQQLLEDEKQRLEEQKKATEKMYDEITDYALDKIGEVEKKQNAYAKKLSSYGGLFEKSTIKFEGQSYDYYALADINADITTIKEYNDLMHQLRDTMDEFGLSDNAKNSLFEEINNLDIDAGKQAMKTLLATNENKLAELLRLYDEKLKFSEGSAAEYYFNEMAEASTQAYQNMVNELEKAGFEIPKGWTVSGTLSAKNFGEAFIKEIDVQLAQISSRIDATLAKLKALNTASSNASTIYQDNRTSTISVTVQSPRQAYEVKRANDTYESHTTGW